MFTFSFELGESVNGKTYIAKRVISEEELISAIDEGTAKIQAELAMAIWRLKEEDKYQLKQEQK